MSSSMLSEEVSYDVSVLFFRRAKHGLLGWTLGGFAVHRPQVLVGWVLGGTTMRVPQVMKACADFGADVLHLLCSEDEANIFRSSEFGSCLRDAFFCSCDAKCGRCNYPFVILVSKSAMLLCGEAILMLVAARESARFFLSECGEAIILLIVAW